MTAESNNIHMLMRKARIAVSREDFEEAERNYALVLLHPEMMEQFDVKMRHAFCIEKTGDISRAVTLYQEIIELYQQKGEAGAAKALQLKVNILLKLVEPETHTKAVTEEVDEGLNRVGSVFQDTAGEELDFVDFLSLGTQEIGAIEAEELTQTLMMKTACEEDIPQENESIDVELQALDAVTPASAPIENNNQDLSTKTKQKKAKLRAKAIKKDKPKKPVPTSSESSHRLRLNKNGALEQENEQSIEELAALIRQGIQGNLGQTKDITKIDLELTSIGEYEPDVDVKRKVKPKTTTPIDKSIEEKASQLFGKTKR
ncbi:MAG: hypothetical protein R8M46_05000 [Ghiorsea sp.]